MKGIGMTEWPMLRSGTVLGILAGLVQGRALRKTRRKTLWVVGAIVVLIVVKIASNVMIPSYLSANENGIYLSIVYASGRLLPERAWYPGLTGASQSQR